MTRGFAKAGIWALAAYALISFAAFGLRLVLTPGAQYVGSNDDPQIFIWSLAWWPHAIAHWQNPLVTTAVWAPSGLNLAWATSMPALALALAPLTLTIGAVGAYNVAAVLMPALAAWTCFLLCRRVSGSFWPSFAGGLLFGFSSYMLGHELAGHLNLTTVFLLPVIALVVLDYADGRIGNRGLVLRLAPILAVQMLLSTELEASLTLALLAALGLGAAFVPESRSWIRRMLLPLVAAYACAAVLTAPFLYYVLSDFQTSSLFPLGSYVADLLNFVVPTHTQVVSRGWTGWTSFGGNLGENDAFLSLPLLAIVVLYAVERGRSRGARFLLAAMAVAAFLALGPQLKVDGYRVTSLPWRAVTDLPVLDNLLTVRFTLYVSLAASVLVAIWAAKSRRSLLLRLGLPVLAIAALIPDPAAQSWATTYSVPPFFWHKDFAACLSPGEIVLPLPIADRGQADLWQIRNGFHFRLAGGRMLGHAPPEFRQPVPVAQLASGLDYPQRARNIAAFVKLKGVKVVVLDKRYEYKWALALDAIAPGRNIGGAFVYSFAPDALRCRP